MPDPSDDSGKRPSIGNIGGDYVGGNKTVTQTAGGDIVGRDKITGLDAGQWQKLTQAFAHIQGQVDARPADPRADKDEIKQTVQRIQDEVKQGDNANGDRLHRWLLNLGAMADDIFQVTVATLTSPAIGLAKVVQLVAQRAKDEKQKLDGQTAP